MKHFDIDGIAGQVQFGKSGASIRAAADGVDFLQTDGQLAVVRAAAGQTGDEVVVGSQLSPAYSLITNLTTTVNSHVAVLSAEIATLQAMVNKLMPVAPDVFEVEPGMTPGVLLGNLKDGHRVASITIDVQEAFDADAELEIGDGSKPEFYMKAAHSDLGYVGTYATTPPDGIKPDDSMVTATLLGSSTRGRATIRLAYSSE